VREPVEQELRGLQIRTQIAKLRAKRLRPRADQRGNFSGTVLAHMLVYSLPEHVLIMRRRPLEASSLGLRNRTNHNLCLGEAYG
jgi:hypothetical protein